MHNNKLKSEDLIGKWVDTHVHTVGTDLNHFILEKYPTSHNIVDMSQKARDVGVDYFVALTMPSPIYYDYPHYWETNQYKSSGLGQFPFEYENRYLLKIIQSMDITNALPFLSFSLQDRISEQERNLANLMDEYNVYGLKYHTIADQNNALAIMANSNILKIVEKYNIPILIHSGLNTLSDPLNIYTLAKQNPKIRFCVAHVGDFSPAFIQKITAEPLINLFVDTGPFIAMCMKINATESMKAERIEVDYANPHIAFKQIYDIFREHLVWSSDEPWTITGRVSKSASIYGTSYSKEAELYSACVFKEALSLNVRKYLFGH